MDIQKDLTDFWNEAGWNPNKEVQYIQRWIGSYFAQHSLDYAVLGLSGGLDSSVVVTLLVNALGREKVIGVLLPDGEVTEPRDVEDASRLADKLGIMKKKYDISTIVSTFVKQDPEIVSRGPGGEYLNRIQYGNLKARVRMIKLYEVSQLLSRKSVVVGTTDRSEWLVGFFTKHGDGGVDLEPILNVYKTQVRAIARELGVPEEIISKKSSPNLVPEMTAEMELGFSYEELDLILATIHDKDLNHETSRRFLSEKYGLKDETVGKVLEKMGNSNHKRMMPPSPPTINTKKHLSSN